MQRPRARAALPRRPFPTGSGGGSPRRRGERGPGRRGEGRQQGVNRGGSRPGSPAGPAAGAPRPAVTTTIGRPAHAGRAAPLSRLNAGPARPLPRGGLAPCAADTRLSAGADGRESPSPADARCRPPPPTRATFTSPARAGATPRKEREEEGGRSRLSSFPAGEGGCEVPPPRRGRDSPCPRREIRPLSPHPSREGTGSAPAAVPPHTPRQGSPQRSGESPFLPPCPPRCQSRWGLQPLPARRRRSAAGLGGSAGRT